MKRIVLPVFLYAVIICAVFGRALWPDSGMLLYGDDIHRAYYFFREFFNQWMRDGIFPWWNPSIFGGQPFIADPVVNIWYPPNWLFVMFPLNLVYSWHIALHILWAMVGMYLFIEQLTVNNSPLTVKSRVNGQLLHVPSWVSGVVFGLSGFFMARTFAGHVDVIAAASWIPWVVGAFYRLMISASISLAESKHIASKVHSRSQGGAVQNFISSSRVFVVASCAFALQLLAGYQTMAFFTVMIIGVLSVMYSLSVKKIIPITYAVLAGFVGLSLAAVHILPEQEFFGRSIRTFLFPYAWHAYGSYEWRSLLQFLNPFQFGNQYTYHGPPPNFVEHSAYVGLLGLVLSAIGAGSLFRKQMDVKVRIVGAMFALVVLFGLWVSLGPNAPIDLQKILWQLVPMYHHLRIPPRHLVLVVFGLSGLVGIGLRMIKHTYLQYAVCAVVVVELVLFGRGFISLNKTPEGRHDASLISFLKQDAQPYRLLQNFGVWLPQRDVLDFDGVMAYDLQSATGYDPSILKSYYEFVEALNKSTRSSLVDHDVQVPYMDVTSPYISFLGIKYLMLPYDAYNPNVGRGSGMWELSREDKIAGYKLYTNTRVLERFFLVSQAQFYKTREPILEKLRQDVDLKETVLLRDSNHPEEVVRMPCDKGIGTVKTVSYTPNSVTLLVDTPCDVYLSSSEIFYPGWHAKIDGKEVAIYESNIAFRTLFVSSGKHTITYEYKPIIFLIGGVISLLSVAILFWITKKSIM